MTNEEAKKRLEVWLKCGECPEDKRCYDSHLHSTCEYTDYCDDVSIGESIKVAIEALEQKPCEDAISRQELLNGLTNIAKAKARSDAQKALMGRVMFFTEKLPPVNPQETVTEFADRCRECGKMKRCKDCKYFEYNSVAKVDGIPLIVAHEICSKWGEGCKTSENGYCFLFEPKEEEGKE